MSELVVTAMIFWHMVINVGMVLGMLPVVGFPVSFLIRAKRHIF